jgi:hypothetical protein
MWRYPVGMRMGRFRIDEGKTCGCLGVRSVRIGATVRLVRQRRQQRQRRNRSMVIHMRINGMDDALTWVMTGSTHCAKTLVTRHSSANPFAIHFLIHSAGISKENPIQNKVAQQRDKSSRQAKAKWTDRDT